jgi:hypothetical protein
LRQLQEATAKAGDERGQTPQRATWRVPSTGMKPEHGQPLAGGVETRAAEPAEQFLGTMRSQRQTYGQPENE